MRRWSLEGVVGWAWVLVSIALPLLPSISKTDPPPLARILYITIIPAGMLALPVAIVGSLVLALRRLSRPSGEHAADYDEQIAAPPGNGPDRRPPT